MYTTLDGAKKRAGTLFRAFEDGGIIFPLHRCQAALARAGGFADWHALAKSIGAHPPTGDRETFRARLMLALPVPCRQPALAWLENLPRERFEHSGRPPYLVYDTTPYVMEAFGAYRRHQPLVRIGSGPGQRLREGLVMGRLMNMHDGSGPQLDPDTCALIYQGTLAELFAEHYGNPRFGVEFGRLVDAGVFLWMPGATPDDPGTLSLLPPPECNLADEVADHHAGIIQQWFEWPDRRSAAITTLWEALACLGIAGGERIAKAIVSSGVYGFTQDTGPVIDLLEHLASTGELDTLARAVNLFAAIHPKNGAYIKGFVPSIIHAKYLAPRIKVDAARLSAWGRSRKSWPDDIKDAMPRPSTFLAAINAMVDEINGEPA